jgi:uncharacterized protein (TIGR03437 family)
MTRLVLLVCATAGALLADVPTVTAVLNATTYGAGIRDNRFCPGSLAVVVGTGFGSGATTSVTVKVGGKTAYVIAVSENQINAQLSFDAPIGATSLTVTASGGTSAPFNITTTATAPTLALTRTTTVGVFADSKGNFVSNTHLANAGDTLSLYATGLGATNPVVPAGPAPNSQVPTTTLPTMTVGGASAKVTFAGLAPGQSGLYQINFNVPATAQGNAPVVLSIGGQSSNTATLPLFGISAVVSGASFLNTGTAAPGEIVSIFANGLGSKDQLGVFPGATAQGVSVTFNGIAAPIFDLIASGSQINLIVPSELPTKGNVDVQLTTSAGKSPKLSLIMEEAVPGIFLVADPSNPTAQIAAAQFANTVWLALPDSTSTALKIPLNCTASQANPLSICGQPAAPGDYLVLYTTGLGAATPKGDPNGTPLATGVVAPADGSVLYETVAAPTIKVGGIETPSLFSGIAPGFAGLYQVDFQVPTGVTEGDAVPLTVSMPGSTTGSATLAVRSR